MADGRCSWCERLELDLTPVRHEHLCERCALDYLHEEASERIAQVYGEEYRYKRGKDLPVTPRSDRYR